VRPSREWVVK